MSRSAKLNVQKKPTQILFRKKEKTYAQSTVGSEQLNRGDILCVFFAKGHEHDFTMFKDSRLPLMVKTTVIVDKGYQGITKIHANSLIPFKTSKKHKLTPNRKSTTLLLKENG
jgi:hypothetical protein